MSSNRATIYSNGIADFQRVFQVKEGPANKISIPVRQQHLGDVLASLTISGDVAIVSPPSYQPANLDDSNISIATNNVLLDLARQLAGAEVEIAYGNSVASGKLVGIHEQEAPSAGEPIIERSVVILTGKGLSRVPLGQIENVRFVDETIRSEIEKALSRRLRDIKPNSTFIDLQLSSVGGGNDALVQYTIPAAAWKISYRILINEGGPIEFHGHAIVDNNTDEDWKDFYIAVVMGQPISFTTDLADSKTPRRSHMNVVQESALGAVEVEDAMEEFAVMYDAVPMSALAAGGPGPDAMKRVPRKSAKAAVGMQHSENIKRGGSARTETADVSETGDFCVFESASPVSIDANRSAVIPVFTTTLDESEPVLHFKAENHHDRPFRTLRFKNTTEHSLGRGVCTIYDGTTYAGSCILPATKPDGDALLPHALETSVRVSQENKQTQNRLIGIQVSDGIAYESFHQMAKVEYVVNNRRGDSFDFLLDHVSRLAKAECEVQLLSQDGKSVKLDIEKLKNDGRRVEFVLEPNQKVKVVVVESSVRKSRVVLAGKKQSDGNLNVGWLNSSIIEANTPLANEPAVEACFKTKSSMDDNQNQLDLANSEVQRLTNRQTRLRENIKTGSADQLTAKWQADLGESEDKLVLLEEELIPALEKTLNELQKELFEKLKALALEWKE